MNGDPQRNIHWTPDIPQDHYLKPYSEKEVNQNLETIRREITTLSLGNYTKLYSRYTNLID